MTELSEAKPQPPINLVNPVNPVKKDVPITNSWQVSFAYMGGISAPPPPPMTMPFLRDWTTYDGEDAVATSLRYFSGTATYRTTFSIPSVRGFSTLQPFNFSTLKLAIGKLSSGLAHVFVNGVDCGVVWCAPWEATVPPGTLREGENEIEIRYTNNWFNRLVGDCFLKPEERVTRSNLRYWKRSRKWKRQPVDPKLEKECPSRPSRFSGPSADDELQPSGLTGLVILKFCNYQ